MTTIDVTQENVDSGCKRNSQACPIWRAVARMIAEDFYIHVTSSDVEIYSIGDDPICDPVATIRLPQEAIHFIDVYDWHGHRGTISFPLDIPQEFLKAEFRAA